MSGNTSCFYFLRMAFHDFKRQFDRVDVCHLDPESMAKPGKKKWVANYTHGRWQKGASAGGCRNFPGI